MSPLPACMQRVAASCAWRQSVALTALARLPAAAAAAENRRKSASSTSKRRRS